MFNLKPIEKMENVNNNYQQSNCNKFNNNYQQPRPQQQATNSNAAIPVSSTPAASKFNLIAEHKTSAIAVAAGLLLAAGTTAFFIFKNKKKGKKDGKKTQQEPAATVNSDDEN